jgi:cullin 4
MCFHLVKPQLPANFQDDTWRKLKNAIEAIQTGQPMIEGLEDLYKACENLCSYKMGHFLYTRLQELCEAHAQRELTSLLQ